MKQKNGGKNFLKHCISSDHHATTTLNKKFSPGKHLFCSAHFKDQDIHHSE